MIVPRLVELGSRDRHRLICIVCEDCEGARGIEADAFNGQGIDVVLSDGSLNAIAYAAPDIRC